MHRVTGVALLLIMLTLFITGCEVLNDSSNEPTKTSVKYKTPAKVIEMSVGAYMIGGPSLDIEIKPNSNAIADSHYIVSISEKGRGGRWRSYVSWTNAELNVLKSTTVNMPVSQNEYEAYQGNSSKLDDIFSVTIDAKPLTETEIQDMINKVPFAFGVTPSYYSYKSLAVRCCYD